MKKLNKEIIIRRVNNNVITKPTLPEISLESSQKPQEDELDIKKEDLVKLTKVLRNRGQDKLAKKVEKLFNQGENWDLSAYLKSLRSKYKYTQKELAQKIETNTSIVGAIEAGNLEPSLKFLLRVDTTFLNDRSELISNMITKKIWDNTR